MVTPLYPAYHRAMEASRKIRLRFTGPGSTSLPLPSSLARFHSGCFFSNAWFSNASLGSRMVSSSTITDTAIMPATMRNRGW